MEVAKALYIVEDEPSQRDHHEDDERDGDEHHGRPVRKSTDTKQIRLYTHGQTKMVYTGIANKR